MYHQHHIDIAAPPETIWPVLTDVEHWPDLTPSMNTVRLLDGTFEEGSRVRITQPKLAPAIWRVTVVDPPHSFSWETSTFGMHVIANHRIEATSAGSRLTLELNATGLTAGIIGALSGPMTKRYVALEAEGIKRRVEAGPGA